MKEYEVKVTTVTTVFVEANSEREAIKEACKEALFITPDSTDAIIVNANEEDEDEEDDDFNGVIDNGKNIKMINLTGDCEIDKEWTLSDCEYGCPRYHTCYAVALANDILREYEESHS